jgi:hypothetical protein
VSERAIAATHVSRRILFICSLPHPAPAPVGSMDGL